MTNDLDSLLKEYFFFLFIEEEAKDFLYRIEREDWEDFLSATLRSRFQSRVNPIGVYDFYLTILFNDDLYKKYNKLVPNLATYHWWTNDIAKQAVETSSLPEIISKSQQEMVISFLTIHAYSFRASSEYRFKSISLLSRLTEILNMVCERIAYLVQKSPTTNTILKVLNDLK